MVEQSGETRPAPTDTVVSLLAFPQTTLQKKSTQSASMEQRGSYRVAIVGWRADGRRSVATVSAEQSLLDVTLLHDDDVP